MTQIELKNNLEEAKDFNSKLQYLKALYDYSNQKTRKMSLKEAKDLVDETYPNVTTSINKLKNFLKDKS